MDSIPCQISSVQSIIKWHEATDGSWDSENGSLVAFGQEVTSMPSKRVHVTWTRLSSPGHMVHFQASFPVVSWMFCKTHIWHHPVGPQGRHFVFNVMYFMFQNHNTVVLPFCRRARKLSAPQQINKSLCEELRMKVKRESRSQRTEGVGHSGGHLCTEA